MSNGIIFDIPSDGIRNDDNILIELTRNCDVECANDIFKAFQRIYPNASVTILHPDLIKSVRFFHKTEDNNSPPLPF
jgi:hypothetical protein